MKFECERGELANVLSMVSRVVDNSPTTPILGSCLIDVRGSKAFFTATNLDVFVVVSIDVSVIDDEGKIAVPLRTLKDCVDLLSDDTVIINDKKDFSILVKTDSGQTRIRCVDSADFPVLPKTNKTKDKFFVQANDFRKAISRVSFSVGGNDVKNPMLTGVFFSAENNLLKVVSTDQFRVSEQIIKIENLDEKDNDNCFIISPRFISHIAGISGSAKPKNNDEEVKIKVSIEDNKFIIFEINGKENVTFISRMLGKKYINYMLIFPKKIRFDFIASRNELKQKLNQASLFLESDANRRVNLDVKRGTNTKGILNITTKQMEDGDGDYEMDVDFFGDEDVSIQLNVQNFISGLGAFLSKKVKISIAENKKVILIREIVDNEKKESNDYFHLIGILSNRS